LYELRFKIEKGKGVWPAFWFFGGNKNDEIDVFELKGERANELHVDTHCPYGCDRGYKNKFGINANWGDWMPSSNYLYEGFNLMLLDWRPNELIWYINGYPLAYFKGSFPNPMHMFINTQVASVFSAFQPGPDETLISPNNFYVDYVRVWKLCSKNELPLLIQQGDLKISNRFTTDYLNKAERDKGIVYNRRILNREQGMISIIKVSDNKLIVNLIGKINTPKTKFVLKGEYGQYTISGYGRERELTFDSREKELELILTVNKKAYSHKFKLSS
jgi:beta-glucanase (GH16 family)